MESNQVDEAKSSQPSNGLNSESQDDKATPRPWAVADSFYDRSEGDEGHRWDVHVPNGKSIADVEREDDARLIVRAVNSYSAFEAMKDALEAAREVAVGCDENWVAVRLRSLIPAINSALVLADEVQGK